MAEGFKRLGLADWLCRQVTLVGFKEPADVQKYCIPPILEGAYVRTMRRVVPTYTYVHKSVLLRILRKKLYWMC